MDLPIRFSNFKVYERTDRVEFYYHGAWSNEIVKMQFDKDGIILITKKSTAKFKLDAEDIILFSVDQNGKAHASSTEIYIEKSNGVLTKFHVFTMHEPINNLHDTQAYKLGEYIASKICDKYGVKWQFIHGIDSAENKNRIITGLLFIVLVWVMIFGFLIIKNY